MTDSKSPSKALHISLWIAQVLLAVMFGMAGLMKTFQPIDGLVASGMTWAADVPGLVRFIGISELAGAVGLILPAALRIKPILTPVAAVGLLVVMILAAGYHLSRGEPGASTNFVLGAIAAFVAWGRFKAAPIAPR